MWNSALRCACVLIAIPILTLAGSSDSEQCNVQMIYVELEAPIGPSKAEMESLLDAEFSKRGFVRAEEREDADAILEATVRIVDKMRNGGSTFSASVSTVLTDPSGTELFRKEFVPNRKSNTIGATRVDALEERAKEITKSLMKACTKGWKH